MFNVKYNASELQKVFHLYIGSSNYAEQYQYLAKQTLQFYAYNEVRNTKPPKLNSILLNRILSLHTEKYQHSTIQTNIKEGHRKKEGGKIDC